MRTYEQQLNYERLELISSVKPPLNLNVKEVALAIKALWTKLVNFFVLGSEPRVYQTSDASGQLWWYVYDPTTGSSSWFASKDEVLVWLDSRYYEHRRLLND